MEYVHARDKNCSPRPTGNPAIPHTSTAKFQNGNKLPPRPKPLFRGFESPSFPRIATLAVLSLITYPVFFALTMVVKDISLFTTRLVVSICCSGIGFVLGYIILMIGARHLEAATWATVIHMSREGGGMKLRDLARGSSSATSFMAAFYIFRSRFGNRETSRRSRKSYDKRPWSLFIVFFIVLAILGPQLPFLFGRVMEIKTFVANQRNVYQEILIAGDLTQEDVDRAGQFGAWSLLSYNRNTSDTDQFVYRDDTVYFAQPSLSQFALGGSGAGTFDPLASKTPSNVTFPLMGRDKVRNSGKFDIGRVLRYPQWGIRIRCEKLPNPEVNLIPLSTQNFTYAFVPQGFLRDLFGVYRMDLPVRFTKLELGGLSTFDTIPSNIDLSTISYIVGFPDSGEGVSLHSMPPERLPVDYQGWTTVETVFIRLNTSFTPSGHFPVYSNKSLPDANGTETRIGYDAAVCVQNYEPWIVEVYNTSYAPAPSAFALRIVGEGGIGTSLPPSGTIQGAPIEGIRSLSAMGKDIAFSIALTNGVDRMWEGANRGGDYVPSPTAVSFTNGTGPRGYTELSPNRLATIRARIGAANTLPYLAGSGTVVAQSYEDMTLAYTTYKRRQLIALLTTVLVLGIIGELFVPTLPLNIPRREFGAYSWLVLLQSKSLQFEAGEDLDNLMSLEELEERFSDKQVKFVEKGEV